MNNERIPDQSNLGASEVAAILGLSPWASAYDIWARKTGRLGPQEENPEMSAGKLLEPAVIRWASQALEEEVLPARGSLRIDHSPIVCHLDGQTARDGLPVEAKTAGIYGPLRGQWGEEYTDDIPDYYYIQLALYTKATKKDLGYLAALLGGRGFRMYACPARRDVADNLVNEAGRWWDRHIVADTPPELSLPSEDTMRRIMRREATVDLPESAESIAESYVSNRAARLDREKQEAEDQRKLAAMLGDAMWGRLPNGMILGFAEFDSKRFDLKTFREHHPDLAERFTVKKAQRRWFGPKEDK